ncbi:LysR family transcriptional regulator [soil metagenome]
MDWEDLKTFLAVARHGNLSAGARSLGVSQTTMARRLEGLHARLGVRLLTRTPAGFRLTAAGERILPRVERMEDEALSAERAISGEDDRLQGLVRVTSVETFAAIILTPALARLAELHPTISIELITDVRALSLARREADIAIRLAPFEQHEAVVRRIADMSFGLYASAAYVERSGAPDWSEHGAGHRSITVQDSLAGLPEAQWLQGLAPLAASALSANSRQVQLEACVRGMGLACLPRYLGDMTPSLQRLPTPTQPPRRGVWIGVHQDMRETPRIRVVLDMLADEIRTAGDRLDPR